MILLVTQDLNVDWDQLKTKGQSFKRLYLNASATSFSNTQRVKLPLGTKYKKLNYIEEKEISWRTIFTQWAFQK